MSYEGVVSEEDNGLLKGGVIAVVGRCDDGLVEDGVGQDVDQQYFSLGDGEAEEVDGDFVCRGVQDRGHVEWGWNRTREGVFIFFLPAGVLRTVFRLLSHILPVGGGVL